MFPGAPPSLSMVLKPWRNDLRTRGSFFFAAYQAMLSVNQQTIAGAQQSAAKPALFSNPKTGSISCHKTGRAARGLLSNTASDRVLPAPNTPAMQRSERPVRIARSMAMVTTSTWPSPWAARGRRYSL